MRLGGTDTKTHRFQNAAIVKRNAYHGNTMHGRAAAPVAAQCDDDVATIGIAALCLVMRPVDVPDPLPPAAVSADTSVSSEMHIRFRWPTSCTKPFLALPCVERTAGREAEAQRGNHLVNARFVLGGVGADDPQRVGMLLEAALLEAHHGSRLTFV